MKRNNFVIMLSMFIIVIAMLSSYTVYISKENKISQAITTFTTIIGAFAIWFQMHKSKKLTEAEFTSNLNKEFINNRDIQEIFFKLEIWRRGDKKENPFGEIDLIKIETYVTFFETFYSLIKNRVLKIEIIDDLFAYRFFLAVNNKYIQELEIYAAKSYYKKLYELHRIWTKYREKNNYEIPLRNTSLTEPEGLDIEDIC